MTTLPSAENYSLSNVKQRETDAVEQIMPLSHFGIKAHLPGETEVDNTEAHWQDVIDFCAESRGRAITGGLGRYSLPTTLTLGSYFTAVGENPYATEFIMSTSALPTTTGGGWPTVFTVNKDTPPAFIYLRNIAINGGWNQRDYIGEVGAGTANNWSIDPDNMDQIGLDIDGGADGAGGGPDDPDLFSTDNTLDPYHILTGCDIRNIAGRGMYLTGRGEHRISNSRIEDCAVHCMEVDCYDSWFDNLSLSSSGDSAAKFTSGGHIVGGLKTWFAGKWRQVEPRGHGIQVDTNGSKGLKIFGGWSQDTYGAGISLTGSGHKVGMFQIDHPGGGRLEAQNGGWLSDVGGPSGTGGQTRTEPATAIIIDSAKNCYVNVVLTGGDLGATVPTLCDISGSGANGNVIHLHSEGTFDFDRSVDVTAGVTNAKNHNEVWHQGKLIHGYRTQAELTDAEHKVNDAAFGPSKAYMPDGRIACLDDSGDWHIPALGTAVTPV